jgi:3-isopropylmalate/(R)-2-methylmalate dehydratase small subunit
LLPIVLAAEPHDRLVKLCSGATPVTATVDLGQCAIILPGGERVGFEMDPARRRALLEGLDDLEQTLLCLEDIRTFQRLDKERRPWMWQPVQAN